MLVVAPLIALASALLRVILTHASSSHTIISILLQHFLVVVMGVMGLYFFAGHVFKSEYVAHQIGWTPGSPFQIELGFANLGMGLAGLLCAWFQGEFWLAALVPYLVLMTGAGGVHVYEVAKKNNRALGNAGFQLYYDFLMPIVFMGLMGAWYLTK